MNDVLALLLANLDEGYERRGWYGPPLRGSLRGVTAESALRRPGKGRHNVWELVAHAAYWKYRVRNKLQGVARGSFPMKGTNWFASPARANEKEWRALLELLDEEHRLLRAAIASLSDADLRDAKKVRIVRGVAAHDGYHAGQIRLVRRLTER